MILLGGLNFCATGMSTVGEAAANQGNEARSSYDTHRI